MPTFGPRVSPRGHSSSASARASLANNKDNCSNGGSGSSSGSGSSGGGEGHDDDSYSDSSSDAFRGDDQERGEEEAGEREEEAFMQVLNDPGQESFKALDPSAQQRYRVWASAQPFTTSDGTEERGAKSKRGVGEAGGNARPTDAAGPLLRMPSSDAFDATNDDDVDDVDDEDEDSNSLSDSPSDTSEGDDCTQRANRRKLTVPISTTAAAVSSSSSSSSAASELVQGDGLFDKIKAMSMHLTPVYGPMPAAFLPWDTSLIGTVIGLICAQNTRNEWSSIMYSNLLSLFPGPHNEPDWDKLSKEPSGTVEIAICNGPFYHSKATYILKFLAGVKAEFPGKVLGKSIDAELHKWDTERLRTWLMSFSGIGDKTAACVLLYNMKRLDYAVDANVLRIATRMGWFMPIGISPEGQLIPKHQRRRPPASSASASVSSSSSSSSVPDIEDIGGMGGTGGAGHAPAVPVPLTSMNQKVKSMKQHVKVMHKYIVKCLAYEADACGRGTVEFEEKWAVLYRGHVQSLAHGEAMCHGTRPLCGQCPLKDTCEYAARRRLETPKETPQRGSSSSSSGSSSGVTPTTPTTPTTPKTPTVPRRTQSAGAVLGRRGGKEGTGNSSAVPSIGDTPTATPGASPGTAPSTPSKPAVPLVPLFDIFKTSPTSASSTSSTSSSSSPLSPPLNASEPTQSSGIATRRGAGGVMSSAVSPLGVTLGSAADPLDLTSGGALLAGPGGTSASIRSSSASNVDALISRVLNGQARTDY